MSELRRQLGLSDATLLVVGTIIGSGIFVAPNLVARQLDSAPWILAAWIAGGVVTLFGALAFAELGAMFPSTGGQYVYLREAWGPAVAFLNGWTSFIVIFSGALAWMAVSFSAYLGEFVRMPHWGAKAAAVGLIALVTTLNYRGLRTGANVQDVLTVLKLVGLAVIVAAALLTPAAAGAAVHAPVRFGAFGLAMIACLLSYDGWVAVGLVAGEIREPQKTIPRALFLGVGMVVAAYVAANVAYLRLLSPAEMAAAERVGALSAARAMGPAGGAFLAGLILLSVAGACNGWMMSTPRIYFAMARDGLFFQRFGEVHARFGTPARAILFQGAWSALLAVTGTYETLAAYAMFATWIFYGVSVLGVVRLRRTRPQAERPYRMWGYPVTPLLFAAAACGFVINTLIEAPGPAFTGLFLIAAGLPAYFFWHRRR